MLKLTASIDDVNAFYVDFFFFEIETDISRRKCEQNTHTQERKVSFPQMKRVG